MAQNISILIVDDKVENLEVLALACRKLDFRVRAFEDPLKALKAFEAAPQTVVLVSYEMSPISGIELIKRIHALNGSVRSIVIAERTDSPLVEFLGETDSAMLMLKPIRLSELTEQIRAAAYNQQGATEQLGAVAMSNKMDKCLPLLGCSREITEARRVIAQLASTNEPILVEGPYGTGKPDVVKFIHYSGRYADSPIVLCPCDQMSREMVEKELISLDGTFGSYVNEARNGSLFIRRVESIPLDLQAVLAEKFTELTRVCRVVSCANSMMDDLLEDGRIDMGLYFQLTLHVIHLPGLADRPIDIEEITRFVVADPERYGLARPLQTLEVDLLVATLRRSELAGNLRELIQRVRATSEAASLVG